MGSLWFTINPMENRFYIERMRFYAGVVIFIIGTGLLLAGVPTLRHRLGARIVQLRQAAKGYSGPPTVEAQVGQNTQPFPAQYEKLVVIPKKPAMPLMTVSPQGVPQLIPQPAREVVAPKEPAVARTRPKRTLRIPTTAPGQAETEPAAHTAQTDQQASGTDANLEPVFAQGEIERQAYDLVLAKYTTVSGMVTGNNPALRFKNWGAAKREEDTYWVRLLFEQVSDKSEVSYIWEVKVSAKQVTPLNFNARSLPRS